MDESKDTIAFPEGIYVEQDDFDTDAPFEVGKIVNRYRGGDVLSLFLSIYSLLSILYTSIFSLETLSCSVKYSIISFVKYTSIINLLAAVINAVIIERAGTKAGNKGSDAAKTAIEMANLVKLV